MGAITEVYRLMASALDLFKVKVLYIVRKNGPMLRRLYVLFFRAGIKVPQKHGLKWKQFEVSAFAMLASTAIMKNNRFVVY